MSKRTAAAIAAANWKKYASHGNYDWPGPSAATFVRPRSDIGYGKILRTIFNLENNREYSSLKSQHTILEAMKFPSTRGYYTDLFAKLSYGRLIERKNGRYHMTKLGRRFVEENGLV